MASTSVRQTARGRHAVRTRLCRAAGVVQGLEVFGGRVCATATLHGMGWASAGIVGHVGNNVQVDCLVRRAYSSRWW